MMILYELSGYDIGIAYLLIGNWLIVLASYLALIEPLMSQRSVDIEIPITLQQPTALRPYGRGLSL
jgi:hypothetical protein